MATTVTWILIADGARARLLEHKGRGIKLYPALDRQFVADNRPSGDLATDKSGRTFDSAGQGRHGMEPPTDPHRHEQQMFARSLAQILEEQRLKKKYDQLVIVAPPKTLGDLREALTKSVSDQVTGELNKDLTKISIHDLPDHLSGLIRM